MSVTSGDIKVYGSANMSESDGTTQGGDISLSTYALFDGAHRANYPSGGLKIVSTSAVDTGIFLYAYGRNNAGSIVSGSIPLSGLTMTSGTVSYERIMKLIMSNAHTGLIAVYDKTGADPIVTGMPTGVTIIRRPFYDVSSDVTNGSTRYYYEKVFVRNNNDTNALLGATISEVQGGLIYGDMDFDLEKYCTTNVGYSANTSANRQTAPSAIDMQVGNFDSNAKGLTQDTDLPVTGAIGVWMKLTLADGASPKKDTYTISVSGSSI